MEEDDMVMRVGNSLVHRERDEAMRREGLQAQGSYKEVPKDPLQFGCKKSNTRDILT
jgi:hypothetical protein